MGDQVEVKALTDVFREDQATPRSCAIGSVKSMIGHSKCAAGLAGLIKTAFALHHKILRNPVECGSVVPAGLREHEESAYMIGRPVGLHFDFQIAQRGFQRYDPP